MIRVRMGDRVLEVEESRIRLDRLLEKLCINPEDVVVVRNKRPLTEDVWIESGDELIIHEVVSRG